MKQEPYTVAAFYHFFDLKDPTALKEQLESLSADLEICGTILVAQEGINGTIAGSQQAIDQIFDFLRQQPGLEQLSYKRSTTTTLPFYRFKVRLKNEIVALGVPECRPAQKTGHRVNPAEWNQLISDPDVVVVDTRNDYEIAIGTFKGAVDPATTSFREFPEYVQNNLAHDKQKKIAMFCTGGIRCEKASAYLLDAGFEEVYQLNGGILKYIEEIPAEQSLWQGECFVFDNRVSVDHYLNKGDYDLCHACRHPINSQEKESRHYQRGVSCPYCYDKTSDDKKSAAAERQKQVDLAQERGEQHIGQQIGQYKVTEKSSS